MPRADGFLTANLECAYDQICEVYCIQFRDQDSVGGGGKLPFLLTLDDAVNSAAPLSCHRNEFSVEVYNCVTVNLRNQWLREIRKNTDIYWQLLHEITNPNRNPNPYSTPTL